MRKFTKGLISLVMLAVMIIIILPNQNTEAAVKKTTIKTMDVKSTKAKSKTTYSDLLDRAVTDKYIMALRTNSKGKIVLQTTTDGKDYKDIDIISIVKKEMGTKSDDIKFYEIGAFEDTNTFYITGNIDQSENFLITTKDGSKFTFSSLECTIGGGFDVGYIYKVGSNYLYTVAKGDSMGGGLTQEAPYWISKDLKKWELMNTPVNKKGVALGNMWRLEGVTNKGIVISALDENYEPYQMYYSTDLKTFKKVTSGLNYKAQATWIGTLWEESLIRREVVFKNDEIQSIQFVTTQDYKTWKTVFNYKQANYSSYTQGATYYGTDKKLFLIMEREKDNSLFDYSSKSKKFVEYSTPIKASLISGKVYDDKYQYMVYDKKYILVSDNNFVTAYKFKLPLSNIDSLATMKDKLIVQGKSNYYISISDIGKAIKNKK